MKINIKLLSALTCSVIAGQLYANASEDHCQLDDNEQWSNDLPDKSSNKKFKCVTAQKVKVCGALTAGSVSLDPAAPAGTPGVPGIGGDLAYFSEYSSVMTTTISAGSALPFDSDVVTPVGITSNGSGTITVAAAGIYAITFIITGQSTPTPCYPQYWGVYINGTFVQGSEFSSTSACTSTTTGNILVSVPAGGQITIQPTSGGSYIANGLDAILTIERIA